MLLFCCRLGDYSILMTGKGGETKMTKVNATEMRNVNGGATVKYYCSRCKKNLTFSSWLSIFAYAKLALHQGGIGCKRK